MSRLVSLSENRMERLKRHIIFGVVLYEEGLLDSAQFYLKSVFERENDMTSRLQAAEYLYRIHSSNGNTKESKGFLRFLAEHKKSGGDSKALVSKLNDLYQQCKQKKQEKMFIEEKRQVKQKTLRVFTSLAIPVAIVVFFFAKLKSKKRMIQHNGKSNHHSKSKEQSELLEQYENSNEDFQGTQPLKEAVNSVVTWDDYEVFLSESICQDII